MDLDETVVLSNETVIPERENVFYIQPTDRGKKGTPYFLKGFQITIGRDRFSDVVIPDEAVSRLHAVLSNNDNDWNIADASSKNGVWVNKRRLLPFVPMQLRPGDVFSLTDPVEGKFCFIFNTQDHASICSPDAKTEPKQTYLKCALKDLIGANRPYTEEVEKLQQNMSKGIEEKWLKEQIKLKQELEDSSIKAQMLEQQLLHTKDLVETELTCSICSEMFIQACTLGCSHTFCTFCINQWKERKNDCPVCRTQIKTMTRGLALDNFIEEMSKSLSSSMKRHRAKIFEKREISTLNLVPKVEKPRSGGQTAVFCPVNRPQTQTVLNNAIPGSRTQNRNVQSTVARSTSQRRNVPVHARPRQTAQSNSEFRTTMPSAIPRVHPPDLRRQATTTAVGTNSGLPGPTRNRLMAQQSL